MAVSSTEPSLGPILRQKTFLWAGVAPQILSQLSSVQNSFALGSADGPQATASSALLLPLPDWTSASLASPWLIDQSLFPGLGSAMGGVTGPVTGPISLLGSAFTVDPASSTAILALLAETSIEGSQAVSQTVLIGLGELTATPAVAWSLLLPNEQIHRLLLSGSAATPSLITVGSSLAGDGAISTRYPLQATGPAVPGAVRTYLAGPNDIQAKATDGGLMPATATATANPPALVQVGLASAPTTTGLVPNGGTDVLISALDGTGKLLWERLFGNSSVEQQPRLAFGANGAVVVGATMQGSLGLNPAAGGRDIGLASYGPDGSLIWRRLLGDAGNQSITDLTVAADGTVLVLGLTSAATTQGTSPQGLYGQPLRGDGSDIDSFLTAYSPQGDRLWTYQFGSPGEDLALAMDWMPRAAAGGRSINTLVVVGSQAAATTPDLPQAWVELLELQPTAEVAAALIPPPPPSVDWGTNTIDPTLGVPLAVIRRVGGAAPQLTLQGWSEPGSTVQVRTSLGTAIASATTDATTGRWTLPLNLPQLTAGQLGQGFVLVEARNAQGLISDTTAEPVLFTGTGLPGELPQLLAIDPDGASGSQAPALLQRQITVLGDGPLTTAGQRLLVDYSGTLTNGTPFDSSLNSGRRPFDLTLGAGRVITGWDQGLQGLPLGSQVRLVIPPSLAYGDRATGSIPASSTLVFDVDLRADLSIPELFLRDVVWPEFFGANATYSATNESLLQSFNLDLLGLAQKFGPGDGSASTDAITVSTVSGFPSSYPLLAMGGGGNDSLAASNQQTSLLFGESGDDQLRSPEAAYAFLDGGAGNDRLESNALISWLRGGSGVDTVAIPTGDWRLQRSGTVAGDAWRELGRLDAAGQLLQLLQLQGVERLSLIGTSAKASDLVRLLDGLTSEVIDASALNAINGSAVELKGLYAAAKAGRISGLGNESLTVDPGTAAAADLLELASVTTVTVNANAVTSLTGSAAERNQAFQARGLSLSLPDDQAPALLQVSSTAGSYGPNRTISITLSFDEPVRWQSQTPGNVPVLQLSNGLSATWVPPAVEGQRATEQRFDLLTGSQPPAVSRLQVLGLAGLGQFSDGSGNALAAAAAGTWSLTQAVSITPPLSWTLDVDGDGRVTALGDGLMVIRHLFGAFGGDSLINKAISDTSSLIPQGQTLTSLDGNGRLALADQVRAQVSALLPPPAGLS
jgi:hypothetical protein